MNCPVCGKEMEPGSRNTYAKWDYFLPQGAPKLSLHTTKRIEERGGIVLDDPYTSGKDSRRTGPARLGLPRLQEDRHTVLVKWA